jgi:enoyl-CoA hydratase/carnithine racemase
VGTADIVIASSDATFFDPHVTYGLVAALEPMILSHRMPFPEVTRMALLGGHERMSAERAHAIGFVSEIVERGSLVTRAQELGRIIASQPPAAVQGTVKALWRSRDLTLSQQLASALMYTQVGNPIATEQMDRAAAKPSKPTVR